MDVVKPRWSSASYLLYTGGLTVLIAAVCSLGYLSRSYGSAAYVGWSLLILVVLKAIALALPAHEPLDGGRHLRVRRR